MGFVRADGSTRPAYRALRTVTRHLNGVREARVERDGDAVKIILERDGSRVTVAWSAAPRPATIALPATSARAQLVDKFGQERPLTPHGGAYHLTLAPATTNTVNGDPTTYLIGGSPLLVIEELRVKSEESFFN